MDVDCRGARRCPCRAVECVLDVLAFLIGAGGLAVATLSLLLTFRERAKWYREYLYGRQADALLAIYEAAAELVDAIDLAAIQSDDARARGIPADESSFLDAAREAHEVFIAVYRKWAPLFPRTVLYAVAEFNAAVSFLLGTPPEWELSAEEGYGEDPFTEPEFYDGAREGFGKVADSVREHLAVERLDAESCQLLAAGRHARRSRETSRRPRDGPHIGLESG